MTVSVPADAANVRVLRVMAADAAASADLGFDRFSDLELLVDEAMTILLATHPDRVECALDPGESRVGAVLTAHGAREPSRADELSALVLDALADDLELRLDAAPPQVRLVVANR